MLYKYENNTLEKLGYYSYSDFKGKEKDLENLLAENLNDLYMEDAQLMPIFQERQRQEEPDLLALDKNGNLVVFELKRDEVQGDTTIQVMRYTQNYGQKSYLDLNKIYQKYKSKSNDGDNILLGLKDAHKEAFGLDKALDESEFNKKQKMVIVGNSLDISLINAVEYWKSKKIDIDFLPYRFYKINDEIYFEFFAKPYDYHLNVFDKKGIMFDTCSTHIKDAVWKMFCNKKISAYNSASKFIKSFNKGDYVFYYHKGWGIIGAGIIKSSQPKEILSNEEIELYHTVELLTPVITNEDEIKYVSPSEICELLGKNFYWASTTKKPYLTEKESKILVDELIKRYNK